MERKFNFEKGALRASGVNGNLNKLILLQEMGKRKGKAICWKA